MSLTVIILAAGQGTRMKSDKPKVIHQLAGIPMLQHVVNTSSGLDPDQVLVVIGHQAQQVQEVMSSKDLIYVEQKQQLGTGHAVLQCVDQITAGNDILVLYGDVPLIRESSLDKLLKESDRGKAVSLLSFEAQDPTGYGRIVRNDNDDVLAIVEEKDASNEIKRITESNSGIMLIKGDYFEELLNKLDNDNAQQEYYLTDVVKHAVSQGLQVSAVVCEDEQEVLGVNNQQQLAEIEAIYRNRKAQDLMQQGVKIIDPLRIDIRGDVVVGRDVIIDVNCVLEGRVELGDGVVIGANCVIKNSVVGPGTVIQPMCMMEDSRIGSQNDIGPFARIRPLTVTEEKAKIGNFVEVKKSNIGKGSKVNHLTYIGDTEMGDNVNIGAGTITCNYDGAFKHKTIIEDNVFVGSDTQLVAPVRVGQNATIGAGSTITKDTAPDKLTFSRAKQVSISGWVRPSKKK